MLGRRSSSGRDMPISGRRRPTERRRGGTLWLGLFAISRTLLGGHADGRRASRGAGTVLRVLLACPAAMGRNEVLRFAGALWRTDAAGVAQRAHVADQGDRRYPVPPGVKRIQSCDSDRLAGTRWMEANRDNRVGHLRPSAGTTKPDRSSPANRARVEVHASGGFSKGKNPCYLYDRFGPHSNGSSAKGRHWGTWG